MNLGAPVPTFWCEPTGRTRRSLRCYQATGEQGGCGGYCNSMVPLDEVDIEWDAREDRSRYHRGYLVDADGGGRAVVDQMLDAGNPVAPAERSTPRPLEDIRRLRQQTPRTAAEMRAKLRASAR